MGYTESFPTWVEAMEALSSAIKRGEKVKFYVDAKGYYCKYYVTYERKL
jgi:hypothetical protein